MGHMRVQIITADPDKPPSDRYPDTEVAMILESCVRALLAAESALRHATAELERVLASCKRNRQHAVATAALQSYMGRRSPVPAPAIDAEAGP